MIRTHATDPVPRIFGTGAFAFAFVAFEESRDEQFFRHRVKFDSTCGTEVDNLSMVVEVHNFDDSPRLRSEIRNLVIISRIEWLAAGGPMSVFPYVGVIYTLGPRSSSQAKRNHCCVNSVPPQKMPLMPASSMLRP